LNKVEANITDTNGLNAILRLLTASTARGGGSLEGLKLLINRVNPLEANKYGQDALLVATLNKHLDCITFLLELQIFGEDSWGKAIVVANGQNHTETIQLLESYPNGQKVKPKTQVLGGLQQDD